MEAVEVILVRAGHRSVRYAGYSFIAPDELKVVLNWAYDRFCSALSSDGDERAFSEAALDELVVDPMSLTTLDTLLTEIGANN